MTTLGRHGADESLALAFSKGQTLTEAASAAGVSERTAHRPWAEPAFRRRVADLRGEVVAQAASRLAASMARAADRLAELVERHRPPHRPHGGQGGRQPGPARPRENGQRDAPARAGSEARTDRGAAARRRAVVSRHSLRRPGGQLIRVHERAGVVATPCSCSSPRYHSAAAAARPLRAVVPQMSVSVRRVAAEVLVRWASLTALAHGPPASNRHSSPPRSMLWPAALKT